MGWAAKEKEEDVRKGRAGLVGFPGRGQRITFGGEWREGALCPEKVSSD